MDTIDFLTDYEPVSEETKARMNEIRNEFNTFVSNMDSYTFSCAEKAAGMRKLLEAKDCFVRAAIWRERTKKKFNEDGPFYEKKDVQVRTFSRSRGK